MTDCVISGKPTSGSLRVSGLTVGGLITEVTVDSSSWTALPVTPLSGRNALCIINTSAVQIKLNYDSGVAGYVGVPLDIGNQRFYDLTDQITVYAKASAGSGHVVTVEEIA